MTKLTVATKITSWVAGVGAGIIVDRLIEGTLDENDKTHKKVAVKLGAFSLSAMVAERVQAYTSTSIEEIIAQAREITQPKSTDQ